MQERPRVLILTAYFDWFAGYYETALASQMSHYCDTEVIASNQVAPLLTDSHLSRLGVPRRYASGTSEEHGFRLTRFSCLQLRGMAWSNGVRQYIEDREYDLIIQLSPGGLLPFAGTLARNSSIRIAIYGDNRAMWSGLSIVRRVLKGVAFSLSKGLLYSAINQRADHLYGYTPNTIRRLRFTDSGKRMKLIPLPFDPERFFYSEEIRSACRASLGYGDNHEVILAAGKILPQKRIDLLIEAFRALLETNAGLRLLIAGIDDGAYSRDLRAAVEGSQAMRERVTFLGFLEGRDLNGVFNAADIGVWPRMPAITIQQAMATGLFVILPQNDMVGHLIRPGSGCYFSDTGGGEFGTIVEALQGQLGTGMDASSRVARAVLNSWLGAGELARLLLSDAGFSGPFGA